MQEGYASQGAGSQGSASLEYDAAYGNASLGYNYSDNGDYREVTYGLSGGVVAHRNGITLSQPLGDYQRADCRTGRSGRQRRE